MMRLADLQNTFQHYLMDDDAALASCVRDTETVSVETRLAIYKNAYQIRLIDALASNYPILKTYLGDEPFDALGKAYLKHDPSTFRSIRWFGDQLAVFLHDTPPYCDTPYLAELAQFEWAHTLVFDAADAPVLSIEAISAVPPAQWPVMRFCPHPSLHLLHLTWNVVPIWKALHQSQQPPEPTLSATTVPWVLWRKALGNQFCSLPDDEAWAVQAVLRGETFAAICEGLCQFGDEAHVGMQAASFLKGWVQSGLLSEIEINVEE